jgi:hypothetical protein
MMMKLAPVVSIALVVNPLESVERPVVWATSAAAALAVGIETENTIQSESEHMMSEARNFFILYAMHAQYNRFGDQ